MEMTRQGKEKRERFRSVAKAPKRHMGFLLDGFPVRIEAIPSEWTGLTGSHGLQEVPDHGVEDESQFPYQGPFYWGRCPAIWPKGLSDK
jgi:hypothetical protein